MTKQSLILVLGLLLTACHGPRLNSNNSLVVGLGAPPTTLDPRFATDANSERIGDLLYSALVRLGPDLKMTPELATSWKESDRRITFTIRTDLQFQNGRQLVASDVVYSIDQFKKSSSFSNQLQVIKNAKAINADTVILDLSFNDASLLNNLRQVKILSKESVEKWGAQLSSHPEGSGPYQLEKWNDSELILKSTNFQSHVHPSMNRIIISIIRDDNTRFLRMLKGDVDIISNDLPEEKIGDLKKKDTLEVSISPGLNFNYILLNTRDDRLKNVSLRRALFSSLKRDDIIKFKLDGLARNAKSILVPENPFSARHLTLPTMNFAEAREWVKKNNLSNLELTLKTSDQATTNGLIIAQQMQALGIKVKVQSYEWSTYYGDVKAGRFQMALMRWVGITDPDVYRDTLSSAEIPPGRNRGYYKNPAFDKIVLQARAELNPDKRRALYFQAQQMIIDDMPILPLWYNDNITVINKRVKGFSPIITGSFYPFLHVTKN